MHRQTTMRTQSRLPSIVGCAVLFTYCLFYQDASAVDARQKHASTTDPFERHIVDGTSNAIRVTVNTLTQMPLDALVKVGPVLANHCATSVTSNGANGFHTVTGT